MPVVGSAGCRQSVVRERGRLREGGRHAGGRERVVVVVGSGGVWSVVMPVAESEGRDGATDRAE